MSGGLFPGFHGQDQCWASVEPPNLRFSGRFSKIGNHSSKKTQIPSFRYINFGSKKLI
jgi:hypothetical protein